MEVPARPADIAELIRAARVEAGLSQRELALRIGSRQPVVSRWENGEDEPRLSTLRRLLRACGLSLSLRVDRHDDVDRSQIHQQLAMSPTERLASVVNLSSLLASARRRD